jgi:alcohol dehydrogenase class IV
MRFEFATAQRIVFGPGTLKEAGPVARLLGRRALVVTGHTPARAEALRRLLAENHVADVVFSVTGEPTTEAIVAGVALAKAERCDCVIGFGGGSVLDAAKAIAALLTNDGELLDYLEVIGRAQPLSRPAAPCLAIPTTAGTGAEVTRNAVLASPPHRVKVSLRSPLMLPRVALVDPELTRDLPPAVTAATGLDALTQLIEPFLCARANPLADALCVEGLRRVARSLRRAFADGANAAAREDMSVASLFGGLALANAGLGAVHGFAGPIGGMFLAPHGAVCAALLAPVWEVNQHALTARQPEHAARRRLDEIARLLTGQPQATAGDGAAWLRELTRDLGIPGLRAYGVTPEDFPGLVEKAARASSMKSNPLPLTPGELHEILQRAW